MVVKVPHSGATSKLTRMLLFRMAQRLGEDKCFRCGGKINTITEFSIDHTESWREQPDQKAAYFDLDKIAFSHRSCNYRFLASRKKHWDKYRAKMQPSSSDLGCQPLKLDTGV